jgi:hypothetical protein
LALPFPQLLGNGKDVVQQVFLDQLNLSLLVPLLVLKPLVTSACLASGTPGGLFTPTLACGALLGGLFGRCWSLMWPVASPGICGIAAAGALLAAAMQAPISSVVLVLELTRTADARIVPLMLAVTGAVIVAYRLEARSIYSARIHAGRWAARVETDPPPTDFGRLISGDYGVVSASASHHEVLGKLLAHSDRTKPIYVVDEDGQLVGRIVAAALPSQPPPVQLAIMTAADLAQPVASLSSAMSEGDVVERLRTAHMPELPVLDAQTGRLIGIAGIR